MKHLGLIIARLYPGRHFRIKEYMSTNEVYNIKMEYQLHIEDVCDKKFKTFTQLENYVYLLGNNPMKGKNNE